MATDEYAPIREQNMKLMGTCGDEKTFHPVKAKDMTPEDAADEFYKIRNQVGTDSEGNVIARGHKARAEALRNRASWGGVKIEPIKDLNTL